MVLSAGDKVLVVHRRLYESDVPRFFVGVIEAYEAGVARATGFSWVRDPFEGRILAKPDPRTKILALASGALMVYVLPAATEIESLSFAAEGSGDLWLSDGKALRINLRERV